MRRPRRRGRSDRLKTTPTIHRERFHMDGHGCIRDEAGIPYATGGVVPECAPPIPAEQA